MNPLIIVLGVVLVILVYILYNYFTVTSSTLSSYSSLNSASIPPITSIQSATNVSYSYGIWVYVNSWENKYHYIFTRNNNIQLYLDKNQSILYCDIWAKPTTGSTGSYVTTTITNNFPLQKWTYIVVSMDNSFLDCYLDGKLVVSNQITNPVQPPNTNNTNIIGQAATTGTPIYLGNSSTAQIMYLTTTPAMPITDLFDAYVSKFQRWTTAIDPQTVWNSYLTGNGQSNTYSDYGINMNVIQNNIVKNTYTIW